MWSFCAFLPLVAQPDSNKIFLPNAEKSSPKKIYMQVELMPEFPGGGDSLEIWIATNSRIPTVNNRKKGTTIYYQLVIDKKGNAGEVEFIHGGTNSQREEIIRLIESMPRWTPGLHEGKAKNVGIVMETTFKES